MSGHRLVLSFFFRCILFALLALSSDRAGTEPLITSNVIHRTFHIKWMLSSGTAFTIDHGNKQYVVTARHVVEGLKSGDSIEIFHDNQWKSLVVDVVGVGEDAIDVAVLACSIRLSPSHALLASSKGLVLGQGITFLGYPFGWDAGGEQLNRGAPLPFVKAGIVSAMELGDVNRIFLDAHGNRGFSGGPVLFVLHGKRNNELRVAGVISYYPIPTLLPVVDRDGDTINDESGAPVAYVKENPGFVVAFDIRHAIELIDMNPIGYPLPN